MLLVITNNDNYNTKRRIIEVIIEEINIKDMKLKIVDIYKYKIGGTEEKLRNYYQNKVSLPLLLN